MQDIHAHILPGMDDGPDNWDEALSMLGAAAGDGITGVAATPHVVPGLYENTKERVLELTEELKARAAGIPIVIYPGSEIRVSAETLAGLRDGRYCALNMGRYVLLELPAQFPPKTIYEFIEAVTSIGLKPVIAHPERNPRIQGNMGIIYELIKLGALMQVTSFSITGLFGSDVKHFSLDMLDRKLAHIVSSDAHNMRKRPPKLKDCMDEVAKVAGQDAAVRLFVTNPGHVINNEPFDIDEPVMKKKPFHFFYDMPSFDF